MPADVAAAGPLFSCSSSLPTKFPEPPAGCVSSSSAPCSADDSSSSYTPRPAPRKQQQLGCRLGSRQQLLKGSPGSPQLRRKLRQRKASEVFECPDADDNDCASHSAARSPGGSPTAVPVPAPHQDTPDERRWPLKNAGYGPRLVQAAADGDAVRCAHLLASGVDVNTQHRPTGHSGLDFPVTALMAAAANGQKAVVQLLLHAGALTEVLSNCGTTAFQLAKTRSQWACGRLLLGLRDSVPAERRADDGEPQVEVPQPCCTDNTKPQAEVQAPCSAQPRPAAPRPATSSRRQSGRRGRKKQGREVAPRGSFAIHERDAAASDLPGPEHHRGTILHMLKSTAE